MTVESRMDQRSSPVRRSYSPDSSLDQTPEISDVFGDQHALTSEDLFNAQRHSSGFSIASERTVTNDDRTVSPVGSPFRSPHAEESEGSSSEVDLPTSLANRSSLHRYSVHSPRSTNSWTVSTSSPRSSAPRAMSPYTGQTQASHPYTMYPQDTGVGRTASTSSASTSRPFERGPLNVTAPQHPYFMYAQNTVPEEAFAGTAPVGLGFPGSNNVFFDQMPNDVGDIVGPDGHTEQLPPYSRYETETPSKRERGPTTAPEHNGEQDVGQPPPNLFPNPSTPSSNPIPAEPVSAPNPFSDESTPVPNAFTNEMIQTSNATPAVLESGGAAGALTNVAPPISRSQDDPSGNFKEKVTNAGQRRVCCGVPIWILALTGLFLLIGAAIGGIIGGILGHAQGKSAAMKPSPSPTKTQSVSATITTNPYDANPITESPTLPVPTGQYINRPVGLKEGSNCVLDRFSVTWQCKEVGDISYSIHEGSGGQHYIQLEQDIIRDNLTYGGQLPRFNKTQYDLKLVYDANHEKLGPALWFATRVDKLVVIPSNAFPSVAGVSASIESSPSSTSLPPAQPTSNWVSGAITKPGDKPYLCWWNGTVYEWFIYMNQTSVSSATSMMSTLMPTPSSSAIGKRESKIIYDPDDIFFRAGRSVLSYPRQIKMIEKTIANQPKTMSPYCQQVQILADGSISSPISSMIKLTENEALSPLFPSPNFVNRRLLRARDSDSFDNDDELDDNASDSCFCQWFDQ